MASSRKKRGADPGALLIQIDAELVGVTEGGRRKRIPSFEAHVKKTFQLAIGGDLRAAKTVVKFMKEWRRSAMNDEQVTEFIRLEKRHQQ